MNGMYLFWYSSFKLFRFIQNAILKLLIYLNFSIQLLIIIKIYWQIIEESFFRSSYKTVETSSDVKDVLEINGDLSLGIKAGMFKFRGMGSYLKDTMNVQNAVDILTKVSFRTVSDSSSSEMNP